MKTVPLHRKHLTRLLSMVLALCCGLISLNPFHTIFLSHRSHGLFGADGSLLQITLGLSLIYLAIQLFNGRRRAWLISITLLFLATGLSLLHFPHLAWDKLFFYTTTVVTLVASRSLYTVKSDDLSLRRGVLRALMLFVAALIYGTIGFYVAGDYLFGHPFTLVEALKDSFWQLISFQPYVVAAPHGAARLFLHSIDGMSYIVLVLIIISLFKPIRFALSPTKHDITDATAILQHHAHSPEDFFKLWPDDKRYFFSSTRKSFLAYTVVGLSAIVLDGGAGNQREWPTLFRNFTNFAIQNGWQPSIVHADGRLFHDLRGLGYRQLYIGEEALVNVKTFAETTTRSKHFRYVTNRAQRDHLRVESWRAPLNDEQVDTLKAISDQWSATRGRREYTFIMAPFSREYIKQCDCAVLYAQDTPIAYVNIIPTFLPTQRSIDHLRYTAALPPVGMHFLLQTLILESHQQGITVFNLGLSALSQSSNAPRHETLPDRLLTVIKRLGGRLYSFEGLEQFKNKFKPEWEPRYIYYQPPETRLPRTAADLLRAVSIPRLNDRRSLILIAFSAVAALCYASFPLALLLNHKGSVPDIVSLLGATSEPYAWLYNGLDIICGMLLIVIAYQLIRYYPLKHYERSVSYCLAAVGATIIVAAVSPMLSPQLPALLHHGHASVFSTLLHAVTSVGTNVLVLVMLALLAWFHRSRGAILTVSVFLMSGLWTIVSLWCTIGVGLTERWLIVATGLSLIYATLLLTKRSA